MAQALASPAKKRKKAKSGTVQIRSSNNRLQLVFTFEGKRRFLSTGLGDTPFNRKQAQDKALELERDIAYGEFRPENLARYKPVSSLVEEEPEPEVVNPVAELPDIWFRYTDARKTGKSPATLRMYDWVANHIERCPYKSPSKSQAIFDWLSAHVPAGSTKRILMHLSASCKWAKKSGLLDSNPFDGLASEVKVKKTSTEEEEIFPFTREERDQLIQAFEINRYYKYYTPLIRFLFLTGCRPSEALALQWKHISPTNVSFEQALIYSGKRGLVVKQGLKTQERRKFPVNHQLAELLGALRKEPYNPEALVFPSPKGKYIDWHNFTNRAWQSVLSKLPEIEYRNPYQTRHTFCSLCREANIASVQIAKWVGNSAAMIDRVYAKPVDQVQVPEF